MARDDFGPILGLALTLIVFCGGCDYARMTSDAANDTYEAEFPQMPQQSVATADSSTALRMTGPRDLRNPLQNTPAVQNQGRRAYGYFCFHCHGPGGEGHGTVGQSFAPLPTDLRSEQVQRQNDGELFFKIAFGYQRHPALIYTVSEQDIWSVVVYMRRLKAAPPG